MSATVRVGIAGSAVLLSGFVVACGSSGTSSVSPAGDERNGSLSTPYVAGPATSGLPTSGPATSAPAGSVPPATATAAHSVVQVNGGMIEVVGDQGELRIVRLEAVAGWTSAVDRPGPGQLVVRFDRQADTAQVRFELTATGIQTSTSMSSTS